MIKYGISKLPQAQELGVICTMTKKFSPCNFTIHSSYSSEEVRLADLISFGSWITKYAKENYDKI